MTADRRGVALFAVVTRPFQAFLRLEAASGILLLLSAAVALAWANLAPTSYRAVFEYPLALGAGGAVATFSLRDLINDGLMAIFFLVVGMEIKRELVAGELNSIAKATLPAVAALGGMVLPAAIFLGFNAGGPGAHGWGIPMATDIAFCVGVLTLLKDRVPRALVVFVTALAIFDDMGGIIVIALFYGHGIDLSGLAAAAGVIVVVFVVNRAYVVAGWVYAVLGVALWVGFHHSGIHATMAGVVLGLLIPARAPRSSREVLHELADHVARLDRSSQDEELHGAEILAIEAKLEDLQAPLQRFVHFLHPFVAFAIMPAFALANSGVSLAGSGLATLTAPVALGAAVGLFVGKQLGIFGFTWLAVRLGLAPLPGGASWVKLWGASVIAGIGFTVALFIAALAYPDAGAINDQAKVGILIGSIVSGLAGALVLRSTGRIGQAAPAGVTRGDAADRG